MIECIRNGLRRIRRVLWGDGGNAEGAGAGLLDGPVHTLRDRLHAADPETDRQWMLLHGRLSAARSHPAREAIHGRARVLRPAMAFALLAAAAIVGGVLWWEQPVDTSTYVTGRGEQTSVTLADSSDVTLNHTSALVVSPRGDDRARRVTLAGEAFFHVRRNGTPFIVLTDVGSVEVLGTEFNVRVRDDRLEVGVVSGSVRVTVRHEGRDTSTLLKAGTLLSWARGERPGVPDPLLFAEYPGWLHRKLLFQRASVQSIAREIEMRFDVTVSVQNPRLLRETISGALDATSADGALQTLAHLTGARVRHDARGYHLE